MNFTAQAICEVLGAHKETESSADQRSKSDHLAPHALSIWSDKVADFFEI
jgi:hypothetical protein